MLGVTHFIETTVGGIQVIKGNNPVSGHPSGEGALPLIRRACYATLRSSPAEGGIVS